MANPEISIVVPVYNSEPSLPQLVVRLAAALPMPHEVVLVNDGSRDGSWAAIERLAAAHPQVVGLDLMRNFGQHNALLCGVRAARGPVVVTMDDDLQHPPEEVPKLLAKLAEGHDVVYGYPRTERHGLLRDLASVTVKRIMQSAMGVKEARRLAAFRAFRTDLRRAFADFAGSSLSLDVLLSWGTTRFGSIPVEHHPRRIGQSNYTFAKLVRHTLNAITGFTTVPLRLAVWLGFLFMGFGFALFAYLLVRYTCFGVDVPGFTFLASTVTLFSGVQLFAVGIIGEYVARIFEGQLRRPTYAVARSVGGPGEGSA